jgi:propanol-preferring alcohol dehydrogenase
VVVRVRRTALCGSDVKLWKRGAQHVAGHEIFGVVDAPGDALDRARVVVYIPVHCGRCPSCAAGDTHLCQSESTLVGWNRDGGYAEALAVPRTCLLRVPDDIDDDLAPLLLDTIGTSGHGLRTALPRTPAGPVLVAGAGPIGLGAVIALADEGVTDVDIADPRPERLALAASFGARPVAVGATDRRYALVVEASGAHAARNHGMHVVAPRGVLLLLGENDAPWTIEETKAVRRKDFWMLRSFYFPAGDHAAHVERLRHRRDDYRRLVDATFGLDALPEEFARFARGERMKPMLRFPG